jgi:hypothetical protein
VLRVAGFHAKWRGGGGAQRLFEPRVEEELGRGLAV